MTCEEFGKMLDNYENLTEDEKLSLNEHASQCVHCREELDFMLAMIAQLNALPKIEVPSDFGAKLKKRIKREADASGFGKIIVLVRENYRRYSTVAACLVLAVILGANGKTLINHLTPSNDNGMVAENTVESSPKPEASQMPAAEVAEQTTPAAVSDGQDTSVVPNFPSTPVNMASRQAPAAIEHIQTMSEFINQIGINPSTSAPVYADGDNLPVNRGRMIDENAGIAMLSDDSAEASPAAYSENYKIARGVYRLPNPEIAEVESARSFDEGALPISEIKDQSEMTIARGRYYIPVDEGYIAIDTGNEIGVNGEDAARAEELIRQYADIQDESYYVINSENIPSMLERMNGEGINYQNNMVNADNDKVSFKLVIE